MKKSSVIFTHKMIEYAYPTSTTATKAGFHKTGCWYVSLYPSETAFIGEKRLEYFPTKQEAKDFADSLPNPWSLNATRYIN